MAFSMAYLFNKQYITSLLLELFFHFMEAVPPTRAPFTNMDLHPNKDKKPYAQLSVGWNYLSILKL